MSSAIEIDNSGAAVTGSIGPAPGLPLPELPGAPPLRRRTESGPAPLSFAQERLWFLDQINPGDASLYISRGLRIEGDLNPDLLQRSLQAIVDRHESLRTTFATTQLYAGVDSTPEQLVAESSSIELSFTDLSAAPFHERLRQARRLAQAEAQRAFDLTIGPLIRATLLTLDQKEHVLLLTVHRIISDDRSLALLFEELWRAYSACLKGQNAGNPELPPVQFADYAYWQRKTLNVETLRKDNCFWQARLQDAPAVLELPTDRPRPAVQNWLGDSVSIVVAEGLTRALLALTKDEHTTLFVTLMTAFQIMLARYSRQQTIVTGSEFANRELAETRNMIGPLADTFALRTDLSGHSSFRALLAQVSENARQSEAHQAMPFAKLIEELQLEPSMSYAPVFQVALNLRETLALNTKIAGLTIADFEFDTGVARLDLTVDIQRVADQLECRFEYDSDLFDRQTIERMGRHFDVLLGGIVNNPDQRISSLPLLTGTELSQVLYEWNASQAGEHPGQCIQELFEAAAEKMPEATALVCGADRLSYAELNRRANQLAHYLLRLGIRPENRVGVYLERSVNTIVGLLAILKAGGAYVPIDPAYPRDRARFMLEDSLVPVLITQKSLAANLPAQQAEIVQIDEDWPLVAGESEGNPPRLITPENLAYVIYTSGSTGRPKGVTVTHKTVTHLFAATREQLGFREGDVWTTVHSSAFDFSVWEIWGSLLQGGRLVIVPLELTRSPAALSELLSREHVTILNQTPSALHQLLDHKPDIRDLSLRMIICGGDALDRELAETVSEIGVPVWNFYGPTESTVWATYTKIEPGASGNELTSIGRQISDIEIYVVDESMQAVPVGVPGEICIGGAGLARGYLHRPELSAERFVPNPFSRTAGERIYRTGDLGRHLRNGKIEFLGRLDNQVKLRGFRIELGEIETVLGQHPQVEQAVVIIREDQPGDKRLVGYVVSGFPLRAKAVQQLVPSLRRLLAEKLPDYMVPATFVMLDALPLTPNRKVDRRALPKPEEGRRNLDQTFLAPRDNLERQLANIWEKILDVKTVGVQDSFFELGGHSLLAVRLFAQIENRFGRRLPLAALFQAPTIEQLANVLRETASSKGWSSLVPIQPLGSKPPLYCVHAAGANVLIYRPLSRHLGNEQPVYALQAQGLDGQRQPLLHIEDMAAHYIREMRAFQPEGPYQLLGASFGGLVIFEMAQQLLEQGQEVALMAMLNTNCPVYPVSKKIQFHLAHFRQHGARFYTREIWKTLRRKIGKPTVSVEINGPPDPELAKLVADRRHGDEALVRTVLAILDAEKDYVPRGKIYPGKITFFWAKDDATNFEDNRLGWRRLAAGGLEVHEVPGTHGSMREEPNVAMLVAELRPCLEKSPERECQPRSSKR